MLPSAILPGTAPIQDGPARKPGANSAAPVYAGSKILFLTHTGLIGGAEKCLINLAPMFAGSVLMFADGPLRNRLTVSGAVVLLSQRATDLTAIKRDQSLSKALPALRSMAGLVLEIARLSLRHDLLYCGTQKAFVLAALSTLITRRLLIWHLHDILSAAHFGRQQIRLVVALANARAARVVVPSRAAADAFIAAGGRATLIALVPNGLDLQLPADPPLDRQALRRSLGLPGGFVFGVFSRLSPWKGQHVAIEALTHLPTASCLVVGGALFGEQDYVAALSALASRLGVEQRVHFLGHRADVPTLMRAVDVVVHPSVDPEPFGLTLVEAMLCGTPVIASDSGAASEILDAGAAGRLVPPADARALAEALRQAQVQPEATRARVATAGLRARTCYGVERMRAEINAVVQTTVASRAEPRVAGWRK